MSLVKFGLVGLLNTAIGLAIIVLCLAAGFGDYAANALGYGVGLLVSYVVNRRWTFAAKGDATADEFMRFIACFAFSYAANLLVIQGFRIIGLHNNPIAHIFGMTVYSLMFFSLSRFWTFDQENDFNNDVIIRTFKKYFPELIVFGLAIIATFILENIPLTNDIVWQFWIARQLLRGARLYVDIWEVNPPLWFWSAIPIQYLGVHLHIAPLRLLIAITVASGAAAAVIVGYLGFFTSPKRRLAVMLLTFWMVVINPLVDFGQREHLALIFAVPYAALVARRSWATPSRAVPTTLAVFIGVTAAYGFALKHYFVLIPMMLELWLFLNHRAVWRLFRVETVTLILAALIYCICILFFTPEFLTRMVPMIQAAYGGFETPWVDNVLATWVPGWLCVVGWFVCNGGAFGKRADPLVSALLIVGAGFGAAYFLQAKAWHYHAMPVTAVLGVALGVRLGQMPMQRSLAVMFALAILGPQIITPVLNGPYFNNLRPEVEPILRTVPAGEPVLIVAAHPSWAWPAVEDHGLIWPSRLYAYWMIPAIARAEIVGPKSESLRALGQNIQREVALEIRCSAPVLVMFERRSMYPAQPESFDERAFFLRDPNTQILLNINYREIPPTRSMVIYQRLRGVHAVRDRTCPNLT